MIQVYRLCLKSNYRDLKVCIKWSDILPCQMHVSSPLTPLNHHHVHCPIHPKIEDDYRMHDAQVEQIPTSPVDL